MPLTTGEKKGILGWIRTLLIGILAGAGIVYLSPWGTIYLVVGISAIGIWFTTVWSGYTGRSKRAVPPVPPMELPTVVGGRDE